MSDKRRVSLFRNGRNQAVRIPREFELPGDEAILTREGHRLVLEPVEPHSLLAWLATLAPLEDELPPIGDRPPEPFEL
jgi:antitoxin VapB